MANTIKRIVSMLVNEAKITLFTELGEVLDLKIDGPYDTSKISEFLGSRLTGLKAVEINMDDFMTIKKALTSPTGEKGMMITTVINGQEVQGIFYPQKVEVSVEHEGEQVVIPSIDKLSKHARRASDTNSPSVRNFLRRIAPVVKERLHSAEDLMAFIERSELPLTNDGRIIGYKKVNKIDDGHTFVDVHSGKVKQHLGSRVWMDAEKVDPSRTNSCSNGLHVANLGYLRGFSGSHTLIVLVDPADFIAVPHGETNKARVCSYDIIGVMNADSHNIVSTGAHVDGDFTLETIITAAVEGRAVKPFEAIKVGNKEVLEVTRINSEGEETVVYEAANAETTTSGKSLNTDEEAKKKDIVKMAKTTKAAITGRQDWDQAPAEVLTVFEEMRLGVKSKTQIAEDNNTSTRTMGRWAEKYNFDGYAASKAANMTITERARMMFNNWRQDMNEAKLQALVEFKKARKKGWSHFGFKSSEITQIEKAMNQ